MRHRVIHPPSWLHMYMCMCICVSWWSSGRELSGKLETQLSLNKSQQNHLNTQQQEITRLEALLATLRSHQSYQPQQQQFQESDPAAPMRLNRPPTGRRQARPGSAAGTRRVSPTPGPGPSMNRNVNRTQRDHGHVNNMMLKRNNSTTRHGGAVLTTPGMGMSLGNPSTLESLRAMDEAKSLTKSRQAIRDSIDTARRQRTQASLESFAP